MHINQAYHFLDKLDQDQDLDANGDECSQERVVAFLAFVGQAEAMA